MCRSCGAIVGAGQTSCAVCGASTTAQPASRPIRPAPDRETIRFARALMERPFKFTIIILITNIFIYLMMWQSSKLGFSMLNVLPYPVLIAYGAKLNSLIAHEHQWWRFVTPMFVHGSFLHLLVNMYSLWIIGPYVEKLYGGSKFVVFWVLTGIAGVVASYLTVVPPGTPLGTFSRFIFKIHDDPSVGASGALFGLVGVLFVFGIKFRHELPEGFKRAFGTGLLPMIALNLFIGYVGRGVIDNAAHLGGLVAGAALAIVVDYRRPGERSGVALIWQILRAAALLLVAICFVQTVRHFRDAPPPTALAQQVHLTPTAGTFVVYAKALNEAQEALYAAIQENDSQYVKNAVQNLNNAPYLDQNAHDLRERIRNMLLEAEALNSAKDLDDKELAKKRQELTQRFSVWAKNYNEWLKTVGKTYGLFEFAPKQ